MKKLFIIGTITILSFTALVFGKGLKLKNRAGGHYAEPYRGVQTPRFIRLPVGAVEPEGWLKMTLQAWGDGITGHLHEYRSDTFWNTWDNRRHRINVRDEWQPFEQQAYWTEGIVQLAYILDDERLKGIADEFINKVLAGQKPDGYMGAWLDDPYSNEGDIYVQSQLCLSLMSYYSATKDARIIPAMHKAFRHIYANCRPVRDKQGRLPLAWRGGSIWWPVASTIVHPVLWIYSKTGDPQMKELADLVYKAGQDIPPGRYYSDIQVQNLLLDRDTMYDMHGVDATEVLMVPSIYYLYSGNRDDLNAAIKGAEKIEKYHGQVHGAPANDEPLRGPGAIKSTETCTQTTWSATKQIMFAVTGDVKYADGVERIIFNLGQGSRRPDGKGVQYYTAPNQAACTKTSCRAPTLLPGRQLFNPDADPAVQCCVGQANKLYPNYVKNAMWLASPDNGLAAACYGPSTVSAKVGKKGTMVTITEKTNYPFEEKIRVALKSSELVEFPLYLRVPGWCKDASIEINGKLYTGSVLPGKMVRIERLWASGDNVDINLPMMINLSRWDKDSVAVERGPLVYSLKIKQDWKKVQERFPGFPDWEVRPGSAWNYALCFDLAKSGPLQLPDPFALIPKRRTYESYFTVKYPKVPEGSNPWEYPPIELVCKGKRVDGWELLDGDATPDVPQSPVVNDNPEEKVTLIPYGCAPIRITYFPVTPLQE